MGPDDVLQDGYLAAAQRIEHYRANPALSPFVWLRLVVCQTLVDVHRRHLGAQARDAGREVGLHHRCNSPSTSASLAINLVGDLTSPSRVAARAETVGQVEQAIAGMDPIDQEILALRHFEELTNSEVAEVLGIQQKAASIRYVRAVRRLKKSSPASPASSRRKTVPEPQVALGCTGSASACRRPITGKASATRREEDRA